MALVDYIQEKPIIETTRLILRSMTVDDVPSLKEWMPDKNIYTYWGKGPGKTDKNPYLLFEKTEKPSKSFHLGIELKETERIVGEIWIYLIENNRMAKIAVRFGSAYQGNGYATEAVSAMVRFCFEHTELQRIWTDVDVKNIGSCRALEKCGFTKEGTIRQGKMVSTWCDYYLYGIIKTDISFSDTTAGEKGSA